MQSNAIKTCPNMQAYLCGTVAEKRYSQGAQFIQQGFKWQQLPEAVHTMGQFLYFTGFRNDQKRANELADIISHWFPGMSAGDQQTAWEIIQNKVTYRRKVDKRKLSNRTKHNESRANIQNAYLDYLIKNNVEPGKNELIRLARSTYRSVTAWQKETRQYLQNSHAEVSLCPPSAGIFVVKGDHKSISVVLNVLKPRTRSKKKNRIILSKKSTSKSKLVGFKLTPTNQNKVQQDQKVELNRPIPLARPCRQTPIFARLNSKTTKCEQCHRKIQYIENDAGNLVAIRPVGYDITVYYPHVVKVHSHRVKIEKLVQIYKQEQEEFPNELAVARLQELEETLVYIQTKRRQKQEQEKQKLKEQLIRQSNKLMFYAERTKFNAGIRK